MYKCISVYLTNDGEGKFTFSPRFKEEDLVLKLDVLKDTIYDLKKMYDELLHCEINDVDGKQNIKKSVIMANLGHYPDEK
jgi:hypothetical protein